MLLSLMYLHFTIFFPVFSDMAKSIYILAKFVFIQKKRGDNSLFGYYLAFFTANHMYNITSTSNEFSVLDISIVP